MNNVELLNLSALLKHATENPDAIFEYRIYSSDVNYVLKHLNWDWRIKPVPKPDVVTYLLRHKNNKDWDSVVYSDPMPFSINRNWEKLKLTRDGETGELKNVEIVR